MAKYTFLAIRKPDELKGVYSGEETIKKVQEKIQGVKGISSRTFSKKEEKEALKWAGVKGIADVPQIAITKLKNNNKAKSNNKDTVDIENIISKCITAINKTQSKPNKNNTSEIEQMIKKFEKDNNTTVNLMLASGEKIILQIRDVYYYSDSDRGIYVNKNSHGKEDSNHRFYSSLYNCNTGKYENHFNTDYFEMRKHSIKRLKATKITYLNDGMYIENYYRTGLQVNDGVYEVYPECKKLYISFSAISSMEPRGSWIKLTNKITDETIISKCENMFKNK